MALPPLPPSSTARYFLDYSFGTGEQHTLQVRYGAPATVADVATWLTALLDGIGGALTNSWTVVGARSAAAGSNVTLPAPAPDQPDVSGTEIPAVSYPQFVAWQGRSLSSGRKARGSLFGVTIPPDGSYRYTAGENVFLDTLVAYILVPVPGINLCIDGAPVLWYSYINAGFNAHSQRNRRG